MKGEYSGKPNKQTFKVKKRQEKGQLERTDAESWAVS